MTYDNVKSSTSPSLEKSQGDPHKDEDTFTKINIWKSVKISMLIYVTAYILCFSQVAVSIKINIFYLTRFFR